MMRKQCVSEEELCALKFEGVGAEYVKTSIAVFQGRHFVIVSARNI
jgi:hypothetical protein